MPYKTHWKCEDFWVFLMSGDTSTIENMPVNSEREIHFSQHTGDDILCHVCNKRTNRRKRRRTNTTFSVINTTELTQEVTRNAFFFTAAMWQKTVMPYVELIRGTTSTRMIINIDVEEATRESRNHILFRCKLVDKSPIDVDSDDVTLFWSFQRYIDSIRTFPSCWIDLMWSD